MAKDKFDKAFEDMKSGKIQGPANDDMGPYKQEARNRTGLIFEDPKNNEKVRQSQEAARAQMLDTIKKSMSGPNVPGEYKKKGGMIKKMAKGGTASSRADGCVVRGKTKGKMC
jgi:hypothetical protein